jgi:hypothetical protein
MEDGAGMPGPVYGQKEITPAVPTDAAISRIALTFAG